MYSDIYSMFRLNDKITRHFSVTWGIRQGCHLSCLINAISIGPFLSLLRKRLCGFGVPGCPKVPQEKLIAYADDVTLKIRNSNYVDNIISWFNIFQKVTSACVNWETCNYVLMGDWHSTGPPHLPKQCKWAQDGLKVIGIYFGTDQYMKKNWEGVVDRVIGKIQMWNWSLPQLSYRGRCLVINDLAALMLWHKFTVLYPPNELIIKVQRAFADLFWNGHCTTSSNRPK